jgi:hypothetical protein
MNGVSTGKAAAGAAESLKQADNIRIEKLDILRDLGEKYASLDGKAVTAVKELENIRNSTEFMRGTARGIERAVVAIQNVNKAKAASGTAGDAASQALQVAQAANKVTIAANDAAIAASRIADAAASSASN